MTPPMCMMRLTHPGPHTPGDDSSAEQFPNVGKRNLNYFSNAYAAAVSAVDPDSGNGELCIKVPSELWKQGDELKVLKVYIEFSLDQPKGGLHFVVPDVEGSMAERGAHVFSCGYQNATRFWFPCVDSYSELCTWKLEFTVDAAMVAVSCGDLVETVYTHDMRKKTYHYMLPIPTAAPNISLAVGPFEILVDPYMHEVTHFCLPQLLPLLKHSMSYLHEIFEFFEEILTCRYPYSCFKTVFVDETYVQVSSYASMSIFSTNLLHSAMIIDQTPLTRRCLAQALAQQFFGCFISRMSWADEWVLKGISGYIYGLYLKKTFGVNEYRHWIKEELDKIVDYELKTGGVLLHPIFAGGKEKDNPMPNLHFSIRHPHTLCWEYYKMFQCKAHLVMRLIENRISMEFMLQVFNKLLSLASTASSQKYQSHMWSQMLVSTSGFLKSISNVSGKDIGPLIKQWVYPFKPSALTLIDYCRDQNSVVKFFGSFAFNRKRNVLELEIKQDYTSPGTQKYVGPIKVTVQELDGSFNHTLQIEENSLKHDIPCHSKSRRNKKKKIPLMNGEEVDMDLSAMDADSPLLWIRIDPDMSILRKVEFEQADFMWQYQLRYERDVVAQEESITALEKFPTPASRLALTDILEQEQCFYKVRMEACFCLAKTMPVAMALLRDVHNLCPKDVLNFILDLIKYNDNRKNKFSDNYYRAELIDALANSVTPAVSINNEVRTVDNLNADVRLILEEITRFLNMEKLLPSYRNTITVSCLRAIRILQKNGHIPSDPSLFKSYAEYGHFVDVRLAALEAVVDYTQVDRSSEELQWLLNMVQNDPVHYIRHKILSMLAKNPPFTKMSESSLCNEALVDQLWKLMNSVSLHEDNNCCCLEDEHLASDLPCSVPVPQQGMKRKAETPLGSPLEPGQILEKEEDSSKVKLKIRFSNSQEEEDIDMDTVHDSQAFIYHHLNMLERPSTPAIRNVLTAMLQVFFVACFAFGANVCLGYVYNRHRRSEDWDEAPPDPGYHNSPWISTSGSCKGRCFELHEAEPPGCRCDNLCKTYNSCCSDFDEHCLRTAKGFECTKDRCGESRNEENACHCSEDCMGKGDCCTNYHVVCKGSCGTHAPYMRPVYPTKTFPNLYTLATGLYPESHGIVGNSMHDPVFDANFNLRGREKLNHRWWGGQPIWITAEKQGVKAGTLFWPLPYVYAFHSEQPDSVGHKYGPLSNELNGPLKDIDRIIGQFMDGLKQMKLHRCVNLMIVGDHGMEEANCDKTEFLSSYLSNVDDIILVPGSLGRIRSRSPNNSKYDPKAVVSDLTCKKSDQHFKPYMKQHLPKRLHYANNRRIEDIHLLVERKWHVARFAMIFCIPDLLGLKPAPNNGTHGSLNHLLKNPPFKPSMPDEVAKPLHPVPASAIVDELGCTCDEKNKGDELNQRLANKGTDDSKHLLYGRPAVLFRTKYSILHHSDFISGYSDALSMPLWTSYTVTKQADVSHIPDSLSSCVRPDIRVPPANSQTCSAYKADKQMSYGYLYPPQLASSSEARYDAFLITNAVPMYPAFKKVWNYFQRVLVKRYATERNGVNVISGPIFDYDYDSLYDTADKIKQYVGGSVPVPTHYYSIITSCLDYTQATDKCDGPLSVFSFILPHRADNDESCNSSEEESKWVEDLIKMHTARVRDIEILTGYVGGSVPVPTHYYSIITSCLDYTQATDKCDGPLSVFSFILPHRADNDESCNSSEEESKWVEDLIKMHTARVRDIEILTGLDFYRRTSRSYIEILSLKTYLHTYESEI
ncbi:hypothetical protein EOD39_3948 [Acipenser ruthenus]|uniref:Transcription initiation factor TFIID subunit 2 n=1 Tax=Acipenser ruthenus TaxID=7906 RepID=A0A444UKH3_ACIRT|nr:hypothetical protein EOD39_3948 [Acipenser ruthenus]